jgi:hypothetical protein
MLGTNAPIFCNKTAAIEIAYNHKIGDRSKYHDGTYHVVHEYAESDWISLLQVETAEHLADSCTNGLPQVTLQKLRTAYMKAK